MSTAADHIIHTLEASIEKRLSDHNEAMEAKIDKAINGMYTLLARAEANGKVDAGHLPMSINGARLELKTLIREGFEALGVPEGKLK